MSKIEGPIGVPLREENNFKQGRGADATTPKQMGPAVGRVSGNATKGGGINRSTSGLGAGSGSPRSGNDAY